jgi:hypothetical protein
LISKRELCQHLLSHSHTKLSDGAKIDLLLKFVKPSVITQYKMVTSVPYDATENQHDDDHIAVGSENRTFLYENADDLDPATVKKFFGYVQS